MAAITRGLQLLMLGFLAVARADPSTSREATSSLRGSASAEAAGPSVGADVVGGSAAGPAQMETVPQGHEEDADLVGDNFTEDVQNSTGAEEAAQSLIVCWGAKVCRGTWTWLGHRRVCRGGFYCRGWAVLLAEDVEGEGQEETTSAPADPAERNSEHEGEPMNASELMEILTNTSTAAQSLIVCQGARVCRGGWSWFGRRRVCRGGFFCRPGWR